MHCSFTNLSVSFLYVQLHLLQLFLSHFLSESFHRISDPGISKRDQDQHGHRDAEKVLNSKSFDRSWALNLSGFPSGPDESGQENYGEKMEQNIDANYGPNNFLRYDPGMAIKIQSLSKKSEKYRHVWFRELLQFKVNFSEMQATLTAASPSSSQ